MIPLHRSPVRPGPAPEDAPKLRFRRGRRFPGPIVWFGARSFWGHLWHLAASVIATEDIDSRDWMEADDPETLTRRVARELGGDDTAKSLSEAMDGDLWVDFVADTGDCSSVSHAVAKIIFEDYDVDDPTEPGGRLVLPRGRLLVFGGDTAYPVATDLEIHNRVIVPWNHVLRKAHDGKHRVMIGIPENHDWYAGLDGFGRMFRRRKGELSRASRFDTDQTDEKGQIGHFVQWVEAFRVGKFVGKRHVLPLEGYTPVQSASYWALRLAPGLDLWGPRPQGRERRRRAGARARRSAGRPRQRGPRRSLHVEEPPSRCGHRTGDTMNTRVLCSLAALGAASPLASGCGCGGGPSGSGGTGGSARDHEQRVERQRHRGRSARAT